MTKAERFEADTKAKAVAKRLGIVFEVVPAKEQTVNGKTVQGVRYHVTVKRFQNASKAFAFDYWGTANGKETHEAPSVYDVLVAARTAPSGGKFFGPMELQALSEV